MPLQFNAPPNWPPPPDDWAPPPGWTPKAEWGPAPQGWNFWFEVRPEQPLADDSSRRIFISYRRSDAQAQANGLYDGLRNRLPEASVFMDIDDIPPGVDFERHIREEIEACDQILVLIGDDWLDCRVGSEVRRIDEPGDFVRLEIENGLAAPRAVVIPVLVEGAHMPSQAELPDSIRDLARLNAFELNDTRWRSDLEKLSDLLARSERHQRAQAERQYGPRATGPEANAPTLMPLYEPPPAAAEVAPPPRVAPPAPAFSGPTTPTVTVMSGAQIRGTGNQSRWNAALVIPIASVFCCGIGSFAPPLYAALKRDSNDQVKKFLLIGSAVLGALAIAGWALVGAAPTDSSGAMTGAAGGLGVALVLITSLVGLVVGLIYRPPSRREPRAVPASPGRRNS